MNGEGTGATPEHRLARGRVGLALVAGALAGALIVTVRWLIMVFWALGPAFTAGTGVHGALDVLTGAFIAWLAGMVLIGGPTWWLLHRHQRQGWRAAGLAGGAAAFAAGLILAVPQARPGGGFSAADRGGFLIENNQVTTHGWVRAGESALLLSFVGGVVGLVVWRVAYRPPEVKARSSSGPSRPNVRPRK